MRQPGTEDDLVKASAMSRFRTFEWRNVPTYGLLVVLVIGAIVAYLSVRVGTMVRQSAERDMAALALRTATMPGLAQAWTGSSESLESTVGELSLMAGSQVTAMSMEGAVLADSHDTYGVGDDMMWSVEVREALASSEGQTRPSEDANGEPVFLVTQPVRDDGGANIGAIRFVFPLQQTELDISRLRRLMAIAGLLIALLLLGILVYQAKRTAAALQHMTQAVERITRGDLSARASTRYRGQLGRLANAFNHMANKLQRQIRKRAREKDRLNTVLHVMSDGVIILNKSGQVRLVNLAAARLLETNRKQALNRSFVQVARDHRIAEVWTRCRASGEDEVAAIELDSVRFLRVVVTPFLKGAAQGYLVVLQDLSQVKHLQTVRQDFVSNISHELRTPLASLRALVETLRDGAMDDPPAAHHFLNRMEIEVDALTQMVEELLELSRIESGQVPLRLKSAPVRDVIVPGVERLREQAARKNVALMVAVADDLPPVLVDAGRVQLVVANLAHNAIKYTEPGGRVMISAQSLDDTVKVAVSDTGIGIPKSDVPRIFERFYKTDRARSQGGTGLGLAIAKHIVLAHGGEIWAESVEGEGSTFYYTLPIAEAEALGHAGKVQPEEGAPIVEADGLEASVLSHSDELNPR